MKSSFLQMCHSASFLWEGLFLTGSPVNRSLMETASLWGEGVLRWIPGDTFHVFIKFSECLHQPTVVAVWFTYISMWSNSFAKRQIWHLKLFSSWVGMGWKLPFMCEPSSTLLALGLGLVGTSVMPPIDNMDYLGHVTWPFSISMHSIYFEWSGPQYCQWSHPPLGSLWSWSCYWCWFSPDRIHPHCLPTNQVYVRTQMGRYAWTCAVHSHHG